MRYKAIIFDLDGVLVHTDRYHYSAWKSIADELGIHFDETLNNRLRGVSRMNSLDIILESYKGKLTNEERKHYADKKNHIYQKLLENISSDDLSEDVRHTLRSLRELGIKLAIGSSSKNAKLILRRLGLEHFFDAVSDGTNIVRSKPDPEVFQKASAYLAISPEACLVVEDALSGMDAAIAAHMDCAGIGDAAGHLNATYRLTYLSDLLQIIEN